ncbi:MAG: tetratricopeptide repeat protein [Gallionella sp.]|jgi:hypothetical protein
MFKKVTYGFILSLLLSNGFAFAGDAPTLDQVYKAAQSGKLDEAQRMMDAVLKEHPNSAKAHFVEAELLAKQGKLDRAEAELANAERLKPGLTFANPQAVQDLKGRIATTHRISQPQADSFQTPQGSSFPWGMLLIGGGVIAILFFVMRSFRARNAPVGQGGYQPVQSAGMQPAPVQGYGQQPYAQQYGGGMGQAPAGGMGSGIMGGLATGAAVGVGMVAGEALAHHFMDGGHSAPVADAWADSSMPSNNMGGADFGIADNSSWDDSSNIASSSDSDWG